MPTPLDHLWNGWRANYVRGLESDPNGASHQRDVDADPVDVRHGDGAPVDSTGGTSGVGRTTPGTTGVPAAQTDSRVTDERAGGHKSVFTRILEMGVPDSESNIVYRGDRVFVILNAFPYTVGHVLVLPYRQVSDLIQLTPEETVELWAAVTDATAAIGRAYRPAGINVGINLGAAAGGSVSEHLHVHVLPRWVGDSNFTTTIANARTIPEPLAETADKLREAWPKPH